MGVADQKTAEIRSRIEPALKESAGKVLSECGLSMSDAIRLFLRQVVANEGLPFEVKTPNAVTRRAMTEAREISGKARFRESGKLMESLERKRK